MTIARLAGIERAQLLLESTSRPALHAVLQGLIARLQAGKSRVRWHVEVDPLEI